MITARLKIVYEGGRIDRDILKRHIEEPAAFYYLCGPEPMQEVVLRHLQEAFGIPRSQVRRELFFF